MVGRTAKPTKDEAKRLDALHRMPCCACVKLGVSQPWPTEANHLVDKGTREASGGHMATIPLDGWHHRGLCLDGWTAREMELEYGPSLALNKRAFIAVFGTERELLERVNKVLRWLP